MHKSKWLQILVIIAVTMIAGSSSYADKIIRIRGGTWLDWEDEKGRGTLDKKRIKHGEDISTKDLQL